MAAHRAGAIAALALCILSSCTSLQTVQIHNGPGGRFDLFAEKIAGHIARGDRIVISGYCPSACTMHLAVPGACIKPDAVLGFHGANSGAEMRAIVHPMYAAYLPAPMAARFMAEWQYIQPGEPLARINAATAVQLGAKPCQ